jgi:hypothetical protein
MEEKTRALVNLDFKNLILPPERTYSIMLLSINHISHYGIEARDGRIGQAHSFLFDDQSWIVRYLVVDTGGWLTGRKVIITPAALGKPKDTEKVFPVELTKKQVKESPDIDADRPVSRQQEIKLHEYYGWSPYWVGMFGMAYAPPATVLNQRADKEQAVRTEEAENSDPHLRSTREVIGYKIHAEDGQIGRVDDFIVHVDDWIIRYLVIDTKNWLPGRKVIAPPDWITDIRWADSEVFVNVTRDVVNESPEFDPAAPVNREYEIQLYDYYGRPKYWL